MAEDVRLQHVLKVPGIEMVLVGARDHRHLAKQPVEVEIGRYSSDADGVTLHDGAQRLGERVWLNDIVGTITEVRKPEALANHVREICAPLPDLETGKLTITELLLADVPFELVT